MELLENYEKRKDEIKKRLAEFRAVGRSSDERIFRELVFCLCTPQSQAKKCWAAAEGLDFSSVHWSTGDGLGERAAEDLPGVRFHNTKASRIREAMHIRDVLRDVIDYNDPSGTREWFVENIKGLGYKEASHFLRNIGLRGLAILDRHILKNLVRYGVIEEVPKTMTQSKYMEIEDKMRLFSEKMGIPMDELDLLFWSMETGEVFK